VTPGPARTPPGTDAHSGAPPPPPSLLWEGRPPAHWAAEWGIPGFHAYEVLDSTSTLLRERTRREGGESWTLCLAERQTGGRGRGGNAWESPAGQGLWFSVLLEAPPGEGGLLLLPLRAGLAAARAVDRELSLVTGGVGDGGSERVRLKWPNDLLIGGRKVAGLLCEVVRDPSGTPRVIVGIGVNVLQSEEHFPASLSGSATSVALAAADGRGDHSAGAHPSPGLLPNRGRLLGGLVRELRNALHPGVVPLLTEEELEEVRGRDALLGRPIRLEPGGAGVARGIAANGALLVEQSGGVRPVLGGSVRLLDS